MVVAIVPAAGEGRRMGRAKLLLPYGETTVIGALVTALRSAGLKRILVVTAPADAALSEELEALRVRQISNPDPERGMLSTVQRGVAALDAEGPQEEPLLVCPGDHPAIRPATIRRLLAALRDPARGLVVPTHGGRRGHPLLLGWTYREEIPSLDPGVGLRQLLERHPDRLLEVPVEDPGVLTNLNTPEDYRRARPR